MRSFEGGLLYDGCGRDIGMEAGLFDFRNGDEQIRIFGIKIAAREDPI